MSEQGSQTPDSAGADAAQTQQTPDVGASKELEALKAQLEQATSKIKTLEDDNHKYRDERRKRKAEADDALKKAGEYEPLLSERDSTIAELSAKVESLSETAKKWQDFEAAEAAAIEAEAADLSEESRADLSKVADLGARRRLLNSLKGATQQKPRSQETPASAPAGGSTDFGSLSGEALSQAINRDPEGWETFVSRQVERPMTDYQRRQLRSKS